MEIVNSADRRLVMDQGLSEELEALQAVFMEDITVRTGEHGRTVVRYLVSGTPVVSLELLGKLCSVGFCAICH